MKKYQRIAHATAGARMEAYIEERFQSIDQESRTFWSTNSILVEPGDVEYDFFDGDIEEIIKSVKVSKPLASYGFDTELSDKEVMTAVGYRTKSERRLLRDVVDAIADLDSAGHNKLILFISNQFVINEDDSISLEIESRRNSESLRGYKARMYSDIYLYLRYILAISDGVPKFNKFPFRNEWEFRTENAAVNDVFISENDEVLWEGIL